MIAEGIIVVLVIIAIDAICIFLVKRLKHLNALFGKPADKHKAHDAPNNEQLYFFLRPQGKLRQINIESLL